MAQSYLEVHNLCKTFSAKNGSVEALRGVSLSIGKGEIFGVIGLSGAGKSTLVRCMNLLERLVWTERGRKFIHLKVKG